MCVHLNYICTVIVRTLYIYIYIDKNEKYVYALVNEMMGSKYRFSLPYNHYNVVVVECVYSVFLSYSYNINSENFFYIFIYIHNIIDRIFRKGGEHL